MLLADIGTTPGTLFFQIFIFDPSLIPEYPTHFQFLPGAWLQPRPLMGSMFPLRVILAEYDSSSPSRVGLLVF
jgi:hypothetical protein